MKYLRIFLTLIFVIAGAVFYRGNSAWMSGEISFSLASVPFYSGVSVQASGGAVLLAVFLLGMIFALIHSSLNWIDLMSKNRKISRLESEKTEEEKQT